MKASAVYFIFASISLAFAQTYSLVTDYSGSSFFNDWTFINGIDPNNTGNVLFQTRQQAVDPKLNLTYIDNQNRAIIKLDNVTDGSQNPNYGRASVYMMSNQMYDLGSLIIVDADHLPFGCSVWPAIFTQGQNWPMNGEIDIVENVNLENVNRYALHTFAGCTSPSSESSSLQTGTIISTQCNDTINNEGCVTSDASTNSFGKNFAQNGGGVFATLFDDAGVKTWFFERKNVPSDASSSSPDPSKWPTPSANYPASSCDPTKFIGPQALTIYINICGKFAGAAQVFDATCPNMGQCDSLVQHPINYNDAFFSINFIKVFTGSGSSNSTNSQSSQPSPSNSPGHSSAQRLFVFRYDTVACWMILSAAFHIIAQLKSFTTGPHLLAATILI